MPSWTSRAEMLRAIRPRRRLNCGRQVRPGRWWHAEVHVVVVHQGSYVAASVKHGPMWRKMGLNGPRVGLPKVPRLVDAEHGEVRCNGHRHATVDHFIVLRRDSHQRNFRSVDRRLDEGWIHRRRRRKVRASSTSPTLALSLSAQWLKGG